MTTTKRKLVAFGVVVIGMITLYTVYQTVQANENLDEMGAYLIEYTNEEMYSGASRLNNDQTVNIKNIGVNGIKNNTYYKDLLIQGKNTGNESIIKAKQMQLEKSYKIEVK